MLETVLYSTLAAVHLAFGVSSGIHALMNKRDPRSQLGWLVLCLLLPAIGAIGYWVLGVNRIRTRARRWHHQGLFTLEPEASAGFDNSAAHLSGMFPIVADSFLPLLQISKRVTSRPLLSGNQVEPLFNGEQAYPAMLDAIAHAEKYIYLCTYLFDTDEPGREFIEALGDAADRGVDVRVLVDAIGERYDRPRASKLLRRKPGLEVARFLPLTLSLRGLRVNLRNHRKILVCDGEIGFTGGMNIGGRHLVEREDNPKRTVDLHFSIKGPAVYALEEVFFEDWHFTTGDEDWGGYGEADSAGNAMCRGIKDGPNEDFEKLQWILVGAINSARDGIKIMTPYFIPNRELVSALSSAALRGVDVEIIMPLKNNLPFVKWASQAMLWELTQHGVRFFYSPPPFDHTKLLIVDQFYVNLGSANLDPRSLRLNFEFNLEVYDPELGERLGAHFDEARARADEITGRELAARGFFTRLRDSAAKLFAPYL